MAKNLINSPKLLIIFMGVALFELLILVQFMGAEDSDGERTIRASISPIYIALFVLPLFLIAFLIARRK